MYISIPEFSKIEDPAQRAQTLESFLRSVLPRLMHETQRLREELETIQNSRQETDAQSEAFGVTEITPYNASVAFGTGSVVRVYHYARQIIVAPDLNLTEALPTGSYYTIAELGVSLPDSVTTYVPSSKGDAAVVLNITTAGNLRLYCYNNVLFSGRIRTVLTAPVV